MTTPLYKKDNLFKNEFNRQTMSPKIIPINISQSIDEMIYDFHTVSSLHTRKDTSINSKAKSSRYCLSYDRIEEEKELKYFPESVLSSYIIDNRRQSNL